MIKEVIHYGTSMYFFWQPSYEEVEMLTVVDMLRRAKNFHWYGIHHRSERGLPVPQRHDHRRQDSFRGQLWGSRNADPSGWYSGHSKSSRLHRSLQKLQGNLPPMARRLLLSAPLRPFLASLESGGQKVTCYPSFADKLATGDYVKQPVVTDDNVITSRGMGTCIEFAGAIIEALKEIKRLLMPWRKRLFITTFIKIFLY